jgi:LEA14-like dessication related protein
MKQKVKWIVGMLALVFIAVIALLGLTFKLPAFAGIDEIKIEGMEGKHVAATISAKIYNPNFYALSARKLDYIVTYHDTVIGKGDLPKGLSLDGGDTTQLQLPIKMELEGIFAVYKSMLGKPKCKLDIHLEGAFTFLNYHQGLDLSTEIAPEKFIQDILGNSLGSDELHMEEMKWKSTKLTTSEFSFVSVVKNPLDIPLDLKQLDLRLYNEGSSSLAGEWKLAKPTSLRPQYSTRIPGSIQINHLSAGVGVVTTIFTGELRLDAKGTMTLQLANLPFEIPIVGTVVIDPKTGKGRWE